MIQQAARFAAKAHEGKMRKGSEIPYIVHPLEAAVIVRSMTGDEELIAAAVLHDVLEDTDASEEEVRRQFGNRVADLVVKETDNKSLSWLERKTEKLKRVEAGNRDLKIVVLGDKLSNIRSIARDYLTEGESLWGRFNDKRKDAHAWYYWNMADRLKELAECEPYREYVSLCRQVFGEKKSEWNM